MCVGVVRGHERVDRDEHGARACLVLRFEPWMVAGQPVAFGLSRTGRHP